MNEPSGENPTSQDKKPAHPVKRKWLRAALLASPFAAMLGIKGVQLAVQSEPGQKAAEIVSGVAQTVQMGLGKDPDPDGLSRHGQIKKMQEWHRQDQNASRRPSPDPAETSYRATMDATSSRATRVTTSTPVPNPKR